MGARIRGRRKPSSSGGSGRRHAELQVVSGSDRGTTFDLSRPDVYLIGRNAGEVPLTDRRCSCRHAQLEVLGHGECFLQDLDSDTGTFRNGRRVVRERLEDGDEVRVGDSRLRFSFREEDDDTL